MNENDRIRSSNEAHFAKRQAEKIENKRLVADNLRLNIINEKQARKIKRLKKKKPPCFAENIITAQLSVANFERKL